MASKGVNGVDGVNGVNGRSKQGHWRGPLARKTGRDIRFSNVRNTAHPTGRGGARLAYGLGIPSAGTACVSCASRWLRSRVVSKARRASLAEARGSQVRKGHASFVYRILCV